MKPTGQRGDIRSKRASGSDGPKTGRISFVRLGPVWIALLTAGALSVFFILDCNRHEPVALPTPSPTPAPEARTTPTAAPGITDAATPVAGAPRFHIAVWADARGRWQLGDLLPGDSDYREGQAVPFFLRIDDARRDDVYRIILQYDCGVDGTAAFDFLTSYERDAGSQPALAPEGPGRSFPDATVPVPDDPASSFDDESREASRLFELWGATFDSAPTGPAPIAPCKGSKLIDLTVRALASTVYLLWGGHLGSSADRGEGRGAADQNRPFQMHVSIPGLAPESWNLAVAPGAVSL